MAFCCLSMGTTTLCYRGSNSSGPSASVSFLAGSRNRGTSFSLNAKNRAQVNSRTVLVSAFTPPFSSLSLSSASSFAGSSLGLDFSSGSTSVTHKRRSFVVRARKYALCQTKRNRSRKSLARTHGFRKRMSTTSGRAVISRRRGKGRKVLCTKSNPISGKGA